MVFKNNCKERYCLLLVGSVIMLTACSADKSAESADSGFIIKETTSAPTNWPEHILPSETDETISDTEESAKANDFVQDYIEESEPSFNTMAESLNNQLTTIVSGLVSKIDTNKVVDQIIIEIIESLPVTAVVRVGRVNAETLAACFTYIEIPPKVFTRMENKSFSEDCTIPLADLRYVKVLYYGFDDEIHVGELVVNKSIAFDIVEIFKELFDARYPIERMVLIDEYEADDNLSMEDNNTSSFNFRVVIGTDTLSNHARGLAIDINPLYNPYVSTKDGRQYILPVNGKKYIDRDLECEYYIEKGDVCYNAFISRGFTWGGNWGSVKDYQHFEKKY